MIQKVFALYDSKAEAFTRPFFTPTLGLALRGLLDESKHPDSNLSRYPGDFSLFELGEWDDVKGQVTMLQVPKNHGVMLEYIKLAADLERGPRTVEPVQEVSQIISKQGDNRDSAGKQISSLQN